jgi:tRNA threonylcarbamoyladenosine biosynthesis protein TsaB
MSALQGTGPVILALDTATERLCAALHDGCTIHTHEEAGGAAASARLLPALQALMARAGVAGPALDAIAFVQGPGAFTGLRTACAVTQGLAWGWRRPVLPLDALLLLAEDARVAVSLADGDEVAVAVDARMDEIYAARYAWAAGRWQRRQAPALWSWPALAEAWSAPAPTLLAGSALLPFAERVRWPAGARQLPEAQDRARALGRLAAMAFAEGGFVDAAGALPLYLRDKVAQTTAERAATAIAAATATR